MDGVAIYAKKIYVTYWFIIMIKQSTVGWIWTAHSRTNIRLKYNWEIKWGFKISNFLSATALFRKFCTFEQVLHLWSTCAYII